MKPFLKITDCARVTGLSCFYLRNGVKDGTVPHIRSGNKILVNVPALLQKLGVPDTSEVINNIDEK